MEKNVAIYRTAYPLYSETFIGEQVGALKCWRPTVVCRDFVGDRPAGIVQIDGQLRGLKKLCFTAFGSTWGFTGLNALEDIRLIHAHFLQDAVLAAPIAQKLRVPLVVTCHGSDVMLTAMSRAKSGRLSDIRYLIQRSQLMEFGAVFIAVSDFLKCQMLKGDFPHSKVRRHYIGVDTDKFVPHRSNPAATGRRFILNVARHSEVKGVDVLLRAFAAAAKKHPDVDLVQIGSGQETEKLRGLAAKLKIEGRVRFVGSQVQSQVLTYMQRASALVLSSKKARSGAEEAFGLVLLEGAACELPCIGTKTGGIPEAVVDGMTGYLVDPDAPQALADAICKILSNPDAAAEMGRRGRQMVKERFDLKRQTEALECLYSEIVELAL